MIDETKCPTCGSPQPSAHPAVSGGGEVTALCPDPFHAQRLVRQVDALIGRIGEPTRDKRTLADLTVSPLDPIPVRLGADPVGTATAQITGAELHVVARISVRPGAEVVLLQLLSGELHAHMDVRCRRIHSRRDDHDGVILEDVRLSGLTLTAAEPAWDGTWVAPVVAS